MNKLIKQTVYLPVNSDTDYTVRQFVLDEWEYVEKVKSQEGYFFTTEQLNKLLSNVIKQALETAAENAEISWENDIIKNSYNDTTWVDEESITNTFDETFNKWKI